VSCEKLAELSEMSFGMCLGWVWRQCSLLSHYFDHLCAIVITTSACLSLAVVFVMAYTVNITEPRLLLLPFCGHYTGQPALAGTPS